MTDALEGHDRRVSIGGRNITNLQFTDDLYALVKGEQELEDVIEKICTSYKIERRPK